MIRGTALPGLDQFAESPEFGQAVVPSRGSESICAIAEVMPSSIPIEVMRSIDSS